MIRQLGRADFRAMPWANGRGVTLELARADAPDGTLLWRLSQAQVVEDGDFSVLSGIERNLTVLSGPGFDLVGAGLHLTAAPWQPVAFSGDLALRAVGVTGPSEDFNVMTARHLTRPVVQVLRGPKALAPPPGGMLALYDPAAQALTLTDEPLHQPGAGPVLAVSLALRA